MSHEKRLGWAALALGLLGQGALYLWPNARWLGWSLFCGGVICGLIWLCLEIKPFIRDEKIAKRCAACSLLALLTIGLVARTWPKRSEPIVNTRTSSQPDTRSAEPTKIEPPFTTSTKSPAKKVSSAKVTVTSTAEILSRIYMRGAAAPPGQTAYYEPYVQELFYEWALKLISDVDVSNLLIVLHSPNNQDRLVVSSVSATTSDWKPHWLSDFEEPSRPPDDYVKHINLPTLHKNELVTIRVRRPIYLVRGENTLTPASFPDHQFEITTDSDCKITRFPYDAENKFPLLMVQIGAFTKYSGRADKVPLKIRPNPDEPMPSLGQREIEGTLELRCKNDSCTEFMMNQLEARRSGAKL